MGFDFEKVTVEVEPYGLGDGTSLKLIITLKCDWGSYTVTRHLDNTNVYHEPYYYAMQAAADELCDMLKRVEIMGDNKENDKNDFRNNHLVSQSKNVGTW